MMAKAVVTKTKRVYAPAAVDGVILSPVELYLREPIENRALITALRVMTGQPYLTCCV